jgi:hypothetical protein
MILPAKDGVLTGHLAREKALDGQQVQPVQRCVPGVDCHHYGGVTQESSGWRLLAAARWPPLGGPRCAALDHPGRDGVGQDGAQEERSHGAHQSYVQRQSEKEQEADAGYHFHHDRYSHPRESQSSLQEPPVQVQGEGYNCGKSRQKK